MREREKVCWHLREHAIETSASTTQPAVPIGALWGPFQCARPSAHTRDVEVHFAVRGTMSRRNTNWYLARRWRLCNWPREPAGTTLSHRHAVLFCGGGARARSHGHGSRSPQNAKRATWAEESSTGALSGHLSTLCVHPRRRGAFCGACCDAHCHSGSKIRTWTRQYNPQPPQH